MVATDLLIEVSGVTKRFDDVTAVDGVSLEVHRGEIVGFLGPNGAGKSTLLRMIVGYFPPDAGSIRIAGVDLAEQPEEARSLIGYLPEHNALYETMRVADFLVFAARARGVPRNQVRERLEAVSSSCTLGEVLRKRVRSCSKGFRQRIGLAAALIHDPPVLILDEPTHGLDPLQVVAFRDFVRGLARDRAVLFSSHVLAEVAEISERLLMIRAGRFCLDKRVDELREEASEAGRTLEAVVLDSVRNKDGATP